MPLVDAVKKASFAQLVCSIFLTPFFVLGLIFFLLWISLHPHRPRFQIHEFSIPGLDQTNGFQNTNITFNVTVRNTNRQFWIYYGSMNASVFYKDQQVGSVPLLDSFDQAPKNTTVLQHQLGGSMSMSTVNNESWMEFVNDRTQGTVIFELRFRSIIHFRKCIWDRRHHPMQVNCDAGVGLDGLIFPSFKDKKCIVHFSWFNST